MMLFFFPFYSKKLVPEIYGSHLVVNENLKKKDAIREFRDKDSVLDFSDENSGGLLVCYRNGVPKALHHQLPICGRP